MNSLSNPESSRANTSVYSARCHTGAPTAVLGRKPPPHLHLIPTLPAHRYWFNLSQFPPQLNGVSPVCSISPQESGVWPSALSHNQASLPGPEHPPLPPDALFHAFSPYLKSPTSHLLDNSASFLRTSTKKPSPPGHPALPGPCSPSLEGPKLLPEPPSLGLRTLFLKSALPSPPLASLSQPTGPSRL